MIEVAAQYRTDTAVSGATAVALSRRTVHWLIRSVALVAVAASVVFAACVGGDAGVLTLPVLAETVLVVAALEASRASRGPLRLDALTLFTAWEAMRGCAVPAAIQYLGNGDDFFYRLGTFSDTVAVLWIAVLFFLVVIVSRVAFALLGDHGGQRSGPTAVPPVTPSRVAPWALVGLGVVGMVIRFPSPAAVTGFLSGAVDQLQGTADVTVGGLTLVGMVLRPMLFVGLVLVARERRARGCSVLPVVPGLLIAVVFGLASYGLNRATVAYAVIGMVLVFSERARGPVRAWPAAAAVGLLGSFFVLVGAVRATLWLDRSGLERPRLDPVAIVHSAIPYFGTPMQLAAALPSVRVSDPFGLTSFVLSVISPVPGAPDAARTASSTALYNHIVYHSFVGKDQLLPFWYEGFLCFGIAGVLAAGVLVGGLQALSDRWRASASTVLGSYAAALFVLWIAQASVTSINVIEQNVIYFVLPPLALSAAAVFWPSRGLPLPRPPRTADVRRRDV
ncbi:hypothetical protein [Curtobacterium sp. UCD-KPL2560]|uniref:hypothetical protein n=1 Tax=Curtobacterium sp. UCD-KPL2560 TaxID=1885315 RepID=UPI000824DEE1|nr:hypothetical protein [Curtobacterium sp. UCD-KPL2560]